eukprot:6361776-Prymnesium_polylepis.1
MAPDAPPPYTMVGFVAGERSRRVGKLPHDEIARRTLLQLDAMFGTADDPAPASVRRRTVNARRPRIGRTGATAPLVVAAASALHRGPERARSMHKRAAPPAALGRHRRRATAIWSRIGRSSRSRTARTATRRSAPMANVRRSLRRRTAARCSSRVRRRTPASTRAYRARWRRASARRTSRSRCCARGLSSEWGWTEGVHSGRGLAARQISLIMFDRPSAVGVPWIGRDA